jgi:pimeloyl-ACP methyl ester carboxylesterase
MKLPGVGHFPLTEAPERLNPVIEKFVAELG